MGTGCFKDTTIQDEKQETTKGNKATLANAKIASLNQTYFTAKTAIVPRSKRHCREYSKSTITI